MNFGVYTPIDIHFRRRRDGRGVDLGVGCAGWSSGFGLERLTVVVVDGSSRANMLACRRHGRTLAQPDLRVKSGPPA
jgi:hypothetical protein